MIKNKGPSNAVELKDLVYAPIHAVSEANTRLSSNIVDLIASTGDLNLDDKGKPIVHLKTMQMQYQQICNDAEENTVEELINLEVPLLSIYPLNSLKVIKSKVSFDVEIENVEKTGGSVRIMAQVCSKKERKSDKQPRIHFDMELENVCVGEGLARFVDTLNAQVVPKRISVKPLNDSGSALTGKELEKYLNHMKYIERLTELKNNLNEVKEMIRIKNALLNEKTGMEYDEYIKNQDYLDKHPEDAEIAGLCALIKKYKEICADLEKQIETLNEKKIERLFLNENKKGNKGEK